MQRGILKNWGNRKKILVIKVREHDIFRHKFFRSGWAVLSFLTLPPSALTPLPLFSHAILSVKECCRMASSTVIGIMKTILQMRPREISFASHFLETFQKEFSNHVYFISPPSQELQIVMRSSFVWYKDFMKHGTAFQMLNVEIYYRFRGRNSVSE